MRVRELASMVAQGAGIFLAAVVFDAATGGRPTRVPVWRLPQRRPRIRTRPLGGRPMLPNAADARLIVRLW